MLKIKRQWLSVALLLVAALGGCECARREKTPADKNATGETTPLPAVVVPGYQKQVDARTACQVQCDQQYDQCRQLTKGVHSQCFATTSESCEKKCDCIMNPKQHKPIAPKDGIKCQTECNGCMSSLLEACRQTLATGTNECIAAQRACIDECN